MILFFSQLLISSSRRPLLIWCNTKGLPAGIIPSNTPCQYNQNMLSFPLSLLTYNCFQMIKFVVLLALFGVVTANILGRAQSAGVRGRLMCDGRPASGVKVKLYDEDDGGIDDKMA